MRKLLPLLVLLLFCDAVFAQQGNQVIPPAGAGGGLAFVASLAPTCTPGVTSSVELSVAAYTINYCSATNTWSALAAGGSVTSVVIAGTSNQIAVTGTCTITTTGTCTLSIPSSPTLPGTTTGTFSGNLTGNVTGNTSGTAASITGNLTGDTTSVAMATTTVKINGTTVPTNAAADQFLRTTASAVASWATMPDCTDSGGNHVNYTASTHALSCGTSGLGTISGQTVPCLLLAASATTSTSSSSVCDNGTTVSTTEPITAASVSTGSGASAAGTGTGGWACVEATSAGWVPTAGQD